MYLRHFLVWTIFWGAILACLYPASPAYAHKVNVFAYCEGNRIFVESFFPDGKPIEGGKVVVLSSSGEKLFEGVTGKDGKVNFPIPRIGDLIIQVDASMGHKASYILKKSELAQ